MVLRKTQLTSLLLTTTLSWLVGFARSNAAETILLDFTSPTCGPCQEMRPTIQRLIAAGYHVQEIDVTRQSEIARKYGVTQWPTFIVLEGDRETARLVGKISYDQLRQVLTRSNAPPPPGRRPVPLGRSPETFATPAAVGAQQTPPADTLATPQSGRIVADQAPASARSAATSAPNQPPRSPAAIASTSMRSTARLIEASVKISVQDSDGKSAGTGTIVDARSGEALVLTCGHLFRSSAGQGPIEVTLFTAGPTGAEVRTTVPGRLIDFDLDRDLAVISIRPEVAVHPISIAQAGASLTPGGTVTTVGCDNGQNPTAIVSKITANDRYQGPSNVEVAGAPVEGRSGGGLFNAEQQLIGVCFAADPQGDEGLYASLPSIHAKLDSLNLTMVYQAPSSGANLAAASPPSIRRGVETAPTPPQASFAVRGQEPAPQRPPADHPLAAAVGATPPVPMNLNQDEQAALQEIQRRGADSEVICIIRPRSPNGKSEVITLSNASPDFVRALTAQAAMSSGQTTTAAAHGPATR